MDSRLSLTALKFVTDLKGEYAQQRKQGRFKDHIIFIIIYKPSVSLH